MKKLFLTTIFLGLILNIHARGNWQSAYVIVNENDTLFGQVDFRTSRANQAQCVFRKDERSETIIFSPNDILGYRFTPDGKFYVAKEIDINGFAERVFVEFMVQGMLNLYYFVDNNNQSHYLFEDETGRFFSITQGKDEIDFLTIRPDRRFDGIIRYKFKEHYSIARNPERFEFNQRSMINLARTYHDLVCPIGEECIVFENQRPDDRGGKVRYSMYTAVEQFVFGYDYGGITTTRGVFAVTLGAEAELRFPRVSRNFGFYVDVSITRLNHTLDYIMYEDHFFWSNYRKIDLNVFPFTMRGGVAYSYPIGNFTPTARLGFSFKHLFGDVVVTDFAEFRNGNTETIRVIDNFVDRNYPGFQIGLGTEYKLNSGHSLSLYFQFSGYAMRMPYGYVWHNSILSHSLTVYGLRLGYIF